MEFRVDLGRNELFVISEILQERNSIPEILKSRGEEADELGLEGTERDSYIEPVSERVMRKAVKRLKKKQIIENKSSGGKANYQLSDDELSNLMLAVMRTKEKLDENNDWDDFAGSAAAKGLVEEILPYMSQIEDESKIDILQMSSEHLREDLIRPLDENAEALQTICNLLENEFFTYKWEHCPACGEEDCDHIKGFRLAKKSFLWEKLGDLIDREALKEKQKDFFRQGG